MTMQEGSWGLRAGMVGRQLHDKAYFLDLLGDSHHGLGHPEAAIEAYRQAAEVFRAQGAQCSYALCLFKIADSHLSLGEPWHAIGYLEACLPLLRDLGMTRYESLCRISWMPARPSWPWPIYLGRGGSASCPSRAQPSRPGQPAIRTAVAAYARQG